MASLKEEAIFSWRVGSSHYQRSGCPDILAIYNGYLIGLEVKTPEAYKKKEYGCTPNQVLFLRKLRESRAFARVVCSVDQVKEFVQEIKRILNEPFPLG